MNKNRTLKIFITIILLLSFSMGMGFFEKIKESIKRQQFKTAISLINDLSSKKKNGLAYYLKGNSYFSLGRYKQAIASYNTVINNFTSSKFKQKAIFRKADALVKMKNFNNAYEIYEKQLKKLTSPKRRNKLAMIYKKLADSLAFPKKDKEKKVTPKYSNAIPYYKKALEMGVFQPKIEASIKLSMGICQYNLGYYKRYKALAIFEKLIKDFKRKAPSVIPKTRYYLALCYKYYGRKWEAKTHLYILAKSKENIKYSVKGAFELIKLYNFPYPKTKEDLSRGRAVVDMMVLRFKEDKLTEKAVYQLGTAMAYRGNYAEAINTLKRLIREYPKSVLAAESAYKIGEYLINSGRQEEAKKEFRLFLSRFPSSKYWQKAQQKIIAIEFNKGMKLYKKKDYDGCIEVWNAFTKKYPLDSRNPQILLSIGKCWYEKKNYKKAVSVWIHLSQKYSGTKMASMAHLYIGETYANKLNDFEKAFKHYKKVTHWSYRSTAKNRIKNLKEEFLSIETKKVFFTGEKAEIALKIRNLKKMDVKIYYFDLKTYFKKYHSIGSIEKLDIGLIDPDIKFTHKINKFKKYKLFKYNLAIKEKRPGAYLISCNSKKLKATTMLVISDIGLQVKVSPREVFVFTSNLKTGRAMSGVDIIVSNGKEVFLNGRTGSNGIYIKSFKKPRLSKNTSVFAFKDRNIAACIPGKTGYFIGKNSEVLSYISTDRPVYRPGDTVRFKVFMRKRINGRYSMPSGKYNVTFSSPSGLVLYHRKVSLNSYGTVSGKFKMDSSVSQGFGNLSITSVKGVFSDTKRIQIMEFQPKKTTVSFSQDKSAYFPGSKIKLKVKVVHLFGSPAANKILMYKLNKDRWKSAKTDDSGTLMLSIDSVKYSDSPYITIRVKPVWQTSVFIHTIPFLKKEYSISIDSVRKKYIMNEKIQINIALKSMLKISKLRNLQLKLEKYRKGALIIVDKKSIKTDKNGKAIYTFKSVESGKYSLTVSGKSGTGEIISSYYAFSIVDKKDKQKIYILTKTRDFIEGKNPMIHLFSRLKSGLALLTMERDKVIDYRILFLNKGHSSFRINLKRNLFPNFKMTLSRISRDGFHQTYENFKIKRKLKIGLRITPDKKYYKPGQKLSIDINTSDQIGKNRSAELALYVIDDSVYRAIKKEKINIESVFYKPYVYSAMKSASFTPFLYKAKTKKRDKDIISEENRRLDNLKTNQEKRRSIFGKSAKKRSYYSMDKDQDDEIRRRGSRSEYKKKRKPSKDQKAFLKKFADIAYYSAVLKTGVGGKTRISFNLPHNITGWRIVTIGVTKKSHFGMAEKTFISRKKIFFTLSCPSILQEGDTLSASANLHNLSDSTITGKMKYSIESKLGVINGDFPYSIKSKRYGSFKIPVKAGKHGTLKITLKTDNDSLSKTVIVKPKTTEFITGKSGLAYGTIRLYPKFDETDSIDKSMSIRIAPPVSGIVGDISRSAYFSQGHISGKISTLLRLLAHYNYLKSLSSSNRGEINRLNGEILNMLLHFRILQKRKGQISEDNETMAYAFFAISSAKKAGIKLPGYLYSISQKRMLKAFSDSDNREIKALILFALSWNKSASYPYLNRFYRSRHSLKNRELALITTALYNMKRKGMSTRMARILEKRFKRNGSMAYIPGNSFKRVGWFSGSIDTTTLGVLALQSALPHSSLNKMAIEWLLQKRRWFGWSTIVQNGICPFVIGRYYSMKGISDGNYRVRINVNGKNIGKISSSVSKTFNIPKNLIRPGKNSVIIEMDGRGKILYSLRISKTVRGYIKSKNSFPGKFKVENQYPDYTLDDKSFNRGYSIIKGSYKKIKNEFNTSAVGLPYKVQTTLYAGRVKHRYFIVTQKLPAGCRILPNSISSRVRYFERQGDTLIFWVRKTGRYGWLDFSYKVVPELIGRFVIPPASVYLLNKPERVYYTEAKSITILPRGSDIWKNYKMSPNELYRVGEYLYKNKKYKKAEILLDKCINNYTLTEYAYKEIARYLLFINIYTKNWKKIVKYFEILKERYPDLTVPFKEAAVVSRAYRRMNEHERSYQILEGIADGYFFQESTISGALQKEKKIKDSISFMENLFLEYPDHNPQKNTYYTLGQQIADRATETSKFELKKSGVTKEYMYKKALNIFENFLLYYPKSYSAPEAAFSIVTLHIDQERYKTALYKANQYMKTYKDSAFLDSFQYMAAYAMFFQKKFNSAINYCRNVATKLYKNKSGVMVRSKNKSYAIHMLGKIYHSLQKFTSAIKQYTKVKTKFTDASMAIDFLNMKGLSIPEVSTFGTDENAILKIRYKGVRKITMTVYKVDFLILCLKEKNLTKITKVNLAGIKPYYKRIISLSDRLNYLSRIKSLKVPVGKKGAYLVVLKSNSIESSGMIIKSDLILDVLEISKSGTIRVNVRNKRTGRLVRGSVIKFIGSKDKSFKTAYTDLRGMAETTGLKGLSTIVGVKNGHYCFYRGKTFLRKSRYRNGYLKSRPKYDYKNKALEGLRKYRRSIQKFNRSNWEQNIQQQKKGLKLKQLM